jgi:hypothetical protein
MTIAVKLQTPKEEKLMLNIVVVRDDFETVAIVSVIPKESEVGSKSDIKIRSAQDALKAIKKAVTQWVKNTTAGQVAWKHSSNDFNVGDLSQYTNDVTLEPYLHKAGIMALNIEVFYGDCDRSWAFDTILVDRLSKDFLSEDDEENEKDDAVSFWESQQLGKS